MWNKVLISIIIPAFNAGQYIRQCLESIKNQSYSNIEIIVVDDGSYDETRNIVKNEANNDSRIRVLVQDNSGVSSARNNGLSNAKGEYVVFVDADDYLAPDFIEYMYGICKESNADFAVSVNAFTRNNEDQVKQDKVEVIDSEKAIALLLSPKVIVGCWNKIFNVNFLKRNNLEFITSLFYGEGLSFITRAADKADKICVGNRKVYYYRRNNEMSATTKFDIEKMRNGEKALFQIKDSLNHRAKIIDEQFGLHISLFCLGAMTRLINNRVKKEFIADYKRWKVILRNNTKIVLKSKNISTYRKSMILFGRISPYIVARLDRIRRKKIVINSV